MVTLCLILLLLILLPAFLAFAATRLLQYADRIKGTNPVTIKERIIERGITEPAVLGFRARMADTGRTLLNSYITIYTYCICLVPLQWLRKSIYQWVLGCRMGKYTGIHLGVRMLMPHRICMGDHCIIGEFSFLDGRMFLQIGNNVNLSSGVTVWTLQHDAYSPHFAIKGGAVTIEDNVWLSFRATVLPDITIHQNAVIGAHALLTKDAAADGVYMGVPAREMKKRGIQIDYSLKPTGFFY